MPGLLGAFGEQPSCLTGSGSSERHKEKNYDADVKKLLPTLDIGSHINAGAQLLPEAGATQERTLEAVSCSPMLARCCKASYCGVFLVRSQLSLALACI